MLAVEIPPEIETRLDALSRCTRRSRDEHVRDAILEHIENLKDAAVAEERLDAVRQGGETIPLEDLLKRYGVGDRDRTRRGWETRPSQYRSRPPHSAISARAGIASR